MMATTIKVRQMGRLSLPSDRNFGQAPRVPRPRAEGVKTSLDAARRSAGATF
jgi:hypothetical protein